ncbi:MAG: hypothetical protein EXS13_14685 [Planctomycetes bacterium]|nr:hypothetical protein [Planctomycetota bacterium]
MRSVVRLLPPFTEDVLVDDQQDGRLLRRTKEFVEIEVIHYPLNTAGSAIEGDARWRAHVAARKDLAAFVKPGTCANFDAARSKALAAKIAARGTDPTRADDRSLVASCTRWLLEQTGFEDGFTTFLFDLTGRKPRIEKGLGARLEQELKQSGRTLEQALDRELFARSMFEQRLHGSCTSAAILWTGCLRAIGIPTRGVLYVPLVDASDPEEMGWLASNLRHHRVRYAVTKALEPLAESWSSHTMVEVFVGGRWRLLNYDQLGQPSLDRNYFGLMTHVATFPDWSDAEAARTIGQRQCGTRPANDPFGYANPYSCVELSDEFGVHATIDNPEWPPPPNPTLDCLAWSDDPTLNQDILRAMAGTDRPRLLARVVDWSDFAKIKLRTIDGDRRFFLEADGHPQLGFECGTGGFSYTEGDRSIAWLVLPLGSGDWDALVAGVLYQLRARNAVPGLEWHFANKLTITRNQK